MTTLAKRAAFEVLVLISVLGAAMTLAFPVHAELQDATDQELRLERALTFYARALEDSNRDSRIANFSEAEAGFASLLESGAWNAALLTNLGNAALQSEEIGVAVLAYRRALLLDPEVTTALQNLTYVRGLLPSWVSRPDSSDRSQVLFFYRKIPAVQRANLAAAFFLLAAGCLAISNRRREGAWRGLAVLGAAAWALLLASVLFDQGSQTGRGAVVTAGETLARSADSRLSALALPEPLPAGAEVEILEHRQEWTRIRLFSGREVWVRGSSVTRIAQ
ncbi:MAG: SH3 domain-containing protein [Myxococcales bacterium]|nr:SH3 domain-containing protein [Myxococcales bacterium]HIK84942.1 SH3 domain-containing protein [Myxococcales bacterium]